MQALLRRKSSANLAPTRSLPQLPDITQKSVRTRLCALSGAVLMCFVGTAIGFPAPALASPAWTAPVELSVASAESTVNPEVAVNSGGDAVAVWQRWNGTEYVAQAASKQAGSPWGAAVNLAADANEPQVGLDSAGNAVAVWSAYNGSNYVVQSASKPAGGVWGSAVNLSAPGQDARTTQVAVDSGGDAVAVWVRSDGSNEIVQSASKPAGGAWGSAVNLSSVGQEADRPQVAIGAGGNAVAVWEHESGDDTIESANKPAGDAWGAAAKLSAEGLVSSNPRVALDSGGDAVAAWRAYDGSNFAIEAASKPAGGAWEAPLKLAVATPGGEGENPQVALDSGGDAVIVWEIFNGSNYIVESANKPAGGAWGAPVKLSATGENGFLGGVSVDGGGDAVAVWQRWNGSKYVVQAASKPADGAWASAVDLSTATASPFVNPEVALDGGGDAVAVWTNGGETAQASELDQRYLTVTESGSGAITSTPAGINCGSECLAAFAPGTEVTLSAATANGYEFKGWGGACSGSGACKVALSAAKSVSATFEAIPAPPSPPNLAKFNKPSPRARLKAALRGCRKLEGKSKTRCIKRAKARFKHRPRF